MSILLCTIAKKHGKTLTEHVGDWSDYLISCSVLFGVVTSTFIACKDSIVQLCSSFTSLEDVCNYQASVV